MSKCEEIFLGYSKQLSILVYLVSFNWKLKSFLSSYLWTGWNITQNAWYFQPLQVELLFFPVYLFIATEIAFSCEIEVVFSFSDSSSWR